MSSKRKIEVTGSRSRRDLASHRSPRIQLRPYQDAVFADRRSGILVLHWSRQIGKSYTLAAWAVDRLLTQLKLYDSWLITVLSNSRDNGAEFVIKCQQVCNQLGLAMESSDNSPDLTYENMRMEVRVKLLSSKFKVQSSKSMVECIGRIKVLPANPRTARGFSGDLILDEFAFHEDSNAIWEAAEPILSANGEFLCRIASTGNGKHNMFYRMASGTGLNDGTPFLSTAGFPVRRLARSEAFKLGVAIYDPNTRQPITPEQARRKALDKRAYDQNYECAFHDENMALLTHELIQQAEHAGIPIDEQQWSHTSMARLRAAQGELFLGGDIGRHRDLTVFGVLEKTGASRRLIALLRLAGMRLPAQQVQLDCLCALPSFRRACIDMTGLGLGLVEYAQEKWRHKICGVNFASTESISENLRAEGRKNETARVTEIMATDLLAAFEDRSLEIHVELDSDARDDLRKPEKITSPGGRVSIAAVRDEAGHADHFWALALALRASNGAFAPVAFTAIANSPFASRRGIFGMGKHKPRNGILL
jgi:phage FluMu gp28-like protein